MLRQVISQLCSNNDFQQNSLFVNFTSFFINSTRGPEVFCKINFAYISGKHLCWSLFFIKLQSLTLNFTRKKTLAHVFSCDYSEIFKSPFFTKHLRASASVLQWFSQHL